MDNPNTSDMADTTNEATDNMHADEEAQGPMPGVPPLPPTPAPVLEDHVARERQSIKDWVRMELHMMAHGASHEDRVANNP